MLPHLVQFSCLEVVFIVCLGSYRYARAMWVDLQGSYPDRQHRMHCCCMHLYPGGRQWMCLVNYPSVSIL